MIKQREEPTTQRVKFIDLLHNPGVKYSYKISQQFKKDAFNLQINNSSGMNMKRF